MSTPLTFVNTQPLLSALLCPQPPNLLLHPRQSTSTSCKRCPVWSPIQWSIQPHHSLPLLPYLTQLTASSNWCVRTLRSCARTSTSITCPRRPSVPATCSRSTPPCSTATPNCHPSLTIFGCSACTSCATHLATRPSASWTIGCHPSTLTCALYTHRSTLTVRSETSPQPCPRKLLRSTRPSRLAVADSS